MGAMVLGDEEVAVGWAWQGEIKGFEVALASAE